jgi:hypothetical protein
MSRKTADDLRREMEAADPDPAFDAEFDTVVKEFRSGVQAASRRPEAFWNAQRASVLSKVARRPPRPAWKVALVWAATVVFVVAGIGIILDRPEAAPAPDLAAGYDQELLIDVERSLDQEVPEPLDAAFLLTAEMGHRSSTESAR